MPIREVRPEYVPMKLVFESHQAGASTLLHGERALALGRGVLYAAMQTVLAIGRPDRHVVPVRGRLVDGPPAGNDIDAPALPVQLPVMKLRYSGPAAPLRSELWLFPGSEFFTANASGIEVVAHSCGRSIHSALKVAGFCSRVPGRNAWGYTSGPEPVTKLAVRDAITEAEGLGRRPYTAQQVAGAIVNHTQEALALVTGGALPEVTATMHTGYYSGASILEAGVM